VTLYDHSAPVVRIVPPPESGATDRGSTVLIVTRRAWQAVQMGADIRVEVMEIRGSQVRIGIEAPDDVQLYREEVTAEERAQYRIGADDEG